MLHDPNHRAPSPVAEEIRISAKDRDALRGLAEEVAEVAALPVHREKAELWRRLAERTVVPHQGAHPGPAAAGLRGGA